MPLPAPACDREKIHTRQITCEGHRRADGMWDLEAHLTDTKTYAFDNNWRGRVEPGQPVHDMWLRLTVDDALLIHAVDAVTDMGPHTICPNITPNFQRLVGVRIGPGWRRKTQELLGGVQGCTHLLELLGPVATTAFQTVFPWLSSHRKASPWDEAARERGRGDRPALLNSCHAYGVNSPVVQRMWPDWYQDPEGREKE